MSILPNLRKTAEATVSHAYIDTPDFAYDQWLRHLDAQGQAIGSVPGSPTVAIIGGGVSGLCAGYELMRAGCQVAVFEQSGQVGGRCCSDTFPSGGTDIAEMGSMRFPPSEFILDWYLQKFKIVPDGLGSLPDFPDPGVNPTYICYGGATPQVWTKSGGKPPVGFETVANGWIELVGKTGLTKNKQPALPSAAAITKMLQRTITIPHAVQAWQGYLAAFGQQTFYSALYSIFTGASGYDIPGGKAWTFEDFDKFGALGIGSGGFGPLYPIGFTEILRIVIDGLEDTQKFLQPSASLQYGIRSLPMAFAGAIGNYPLPVLPPTSTSAVATGVPISSISGNIQSGFTLTTPSGKQYGGFSRVIVATTTRSMELTLGLTEYGQNALISPTVAQAIMRTHVVSSNKIAARIGNFWSADPAKAVRCLQTDGTAHQIYTLDYTPIGQSPPDQTGVCFISYVWDDDAVKQQSLTSGAPTGAAGNQQLYSYLLSTIESIGGDVAAWAQQNLLPLNGNYQDNVIFEEWQSSPYFGGAFKLSQPGQDPYVQAMFFDYQKAGTKNDTGLFLAGDCISWTSGWVEGALTPALNAAAGVIVSLGGTLNGDLGGNNPMKIVANRYNYFA
jgi:tryptophan 2-monooxygenase